MSGNINDVAYQGMKQVENIRASVDIADFGKIDLEEAQKTQAGSVFNQLAGDFLNEEVAAYEAANRGVTQSGQIDMSLVRKYLGSNSIENGIKGLFNVISYNTATVQDGENAESVKARIDADVEQAVKEQIDSIKSGLKEKYGEAVQKAAAQAAKQQFGLNNGDTEYKKDEDGSVATYDSASSEEGKQTVGYKATAGKLKNAKTFQREVDGKVQTIYVYHDEKGKKQRVIIDDAGQTHNLIAVTKGGKNTYITEDAYQLAQSQSGLEDGKKVKIKRAKVDGSWENTYKDSQGNVHKIDHNEESGENFTVDVEKTSHGGRKKYKTQTSGLGVSGQDARTQSGRNKIDAAHIKQAVEALRSDVESLGGQIMYNNTNTNRAVVILNGHSYALNLENNKETDDQLSAIKSEIDFLKKTKSGSSTTDNDVTEDTRTDAGNWGVDSNHQSKSTNINTISYQKGSFTRANFQREGWKASAGRQREADILGKMDKYGANQGGVHTRNLRTARDFAERFVKASGIAKAEQKYDYDKLAQAFTIANPSIFDANGNMKKNVDFNRINMPSDLSRYEIKD